MTQTDIIENLKPILKPYVQNQKALKTLSGSTKFIEDLKINSVHMVDIYIDIEEAFDIELKNSDLENIRTTKDALIAIQQKLAEREEV